MLSKTSNQLLAAAAGATKSLARRTLSSKTTPVSSAAAGRLRLDSDHDHHDNELSNAQRAKYTPVRGNPGLVAPKYLTHSYTMSRPDDVHLLCDTIGDRVREMARERPSDVGYKFSLTQTSLTFGEIKQRIDELAQNFLQLGFKKGKF